MKLTARQIDSFLKKPDQVVRAILVYGPDSGLVKDRARLLGLGVVSDLNDPFNAAHMTGDILDADPAKFLDEVNAQSLMGGRRLVRVTAPSAKFAVQLKDWLKSNPDDGALVVIEAAELGPKIALRKICEEAPNAATIACYIPDEREMVQFIREMVKDQGKNIEPDAANWLGQALKGDRGRARMEIEKLCIYAGDTMQLTLTDAQASCGEVGDQGIDDLVYAVFGRDPLGVQKSYKRLLEEGTELIIIERSLQNHIRRLHQVKMMMDEDGLPIEMAMKSLQPPIFFKQEEKFRAQVNRYSGVFLRKLLQRFNEIEAETKRTGTPSETLVSDALIKLAAL